MSRTVLILICFGLPLLAEIELSESINDIYYRGTNELIGSLSFRFTANDFPDASPANPDYLAITLSSGALLANTLVDPSADDETIAAPIFLPLYLGNGDSNSLEMGAPADTLSIVRWVAGEDAIWLKLEHGTATWINDGDAALPPGILHNETPVHIHSHIGISATSFMMLNDRYDPSHMNLPFATRNLEADIKNLDDAVSTLRCIDMTDAAIGIDQILEQNVEAYQQDAALGGGLFAPGSKQGVRIVGNFRTARTKDWNIPVVATNESAGNLCGQEPRANESGDIRITPTPSPVSPPHLASHRYAS